MTLSPEQKKAVAAWVAAGDNLSTVQKKLSEQFKLSLTYMDVRFLVDDLGLELKNAAPKTATAPLGSPERPGEGGPSRNPAEKKGLMDKLKEKVGLGAGDDADDLPPAAAEAEFADEELPPAPAGAGAVKVDIDRIVRPGAMVSGSVTFSDGVSGKWALDQYGRLMLETGQKGYQPPAADVQVFQRELSAQLQRQGY
jgi:hypothetical protein